MVMMINLNTTTSEIKPENQFNSLNLIKKYLFHCYAHQLRKTLPRSITNARQSAGYIYQKIT